MVDLPQPDGPTSATNSPSAIRNVVLESAGTVRAAAEGDGSVRQLDRDRLGGGRNRRAGEFLVGLHAHHGKSACKPDASKTCFKIQRDRQFRAKSAAISFWAVLYTPQICMQSGGQLLANCDIRCPFEALPPADSRPMAPRLGSKTVELSDKVSVICRALRRAIIEQVLAPGAKLPEDLRLGERFGVSRTIARHALGQLAAEGLVELRRNRIAVVATPSWQEARDAFDIRIELERLVVRQLAGNDQGAGRRVDRPCRCTRTAPATAATPVSIRLATEFHILLAHMTNSPILFVTSAKSPIAAASLCP